MPKLMLEIDLDLYRLLQQAARSNASSLKDECQRHIETVLAELKASSEQGQRER